MPLARVHESLILVALIGQIGSCNNFDDSVVTTTISDLRLFPCVEKKKRKKKRKEKKCVADSFW